MGWQTDVIAQLVFNKETYNSYYQVDDEINQNKRTIQNIIEELSVMATARPEDLLIHNEDMDLMGLQREVKDKIEILGECIIENYKLECLKENFDLRDGDFIENPKRKEAVKNWLINNFILEPKDFSNIDVDNNNNNTIESD